MNRTPRRYGSMLQEYYVERMRAAHAAHADRLAWVGTPDDVRALQVEVRRRIRQSFAPLPRPVPANARVTGVIDDPRGGYRVEKLLLDTRPGFTVSANLYLPTRGDGPAPAVLATCGHSQDGKAFEVYQSFAQALARRGFAVLIYDPISQGERVQYPDARGVPSLGLCAEHNMVGKQLALVGDFFGSWRANDGLRALDYLLSRPEVDPTRVGVTGNSGGGTMTTWLAGLDERITMAAPGCFVSTFLANCENELPADAEQIPPRIVEHGLEMYDFYIPHAPRPLILLAQRHDFFDRRAVMEAYTQLRRIYRLLGAEQNVQVYFGPQGHGFSLHLRKQLYAFFGRHAGLDDRPREPKLVIRTPQELAAAPAGTVVRAGSARVIDFIRARADELGAKRKPPAPERLPALLAKMLRLPRRIGTPNYRVLRMTFDSRKKRLYRFGVETGPGIQTIVTMPAGDVPGFGLPTGGGRATLLVGHTASADDLELPAVRRLLAGAGRVFAADPRGLGETTPCTCDDGDFFSPYDSDYFYHSQGLMLGEPLVGRRVHDVLATLDWLAGNGFGPIDLVGRGLGAIWSLLAATVRGNLASVTLVNGPLSYLDLAQVEICRWPASAMVPHALTKFDLPDCVRAIGRKLRLVAPWDAAMKPLRPAAARKRLRELKLPASLLRLKVRS
ncbi:MAG: hypothetical protein BIFFINMI_01872 [Phycisphaerae bacterium]|nr:hypothetical protein [Phycisphaerae bacterium]